MGVKEKMDCAESIRENNDKRGKTLFQWIIPTCRWIKWCGIAFVILVAGSFIFLQLWAEYVYRPRLIQSVGLQKYQTMKKFWETPVNFPQEYITGIPISDRLKKTYADLSTAYDSKNDTAFNVQETTNLWYKYRMGQTSDIQEMDKRIRNFEPCLQAGLNVSRQIERDLQSCKPGGLLLLLQDRSNAYMWLDDLFGIQVDYLSRTERFEEAFDYSIRSFFLKVRSPYQDFWGYCRNQSMMAYWIKEYAALIPYLSSPERLRSWLNALNFLQPFLFQDVLDQSFSLQFLSVIKSYGSPIDPDEITMKKPYGYYIHQLAIHQKGMNNSPFIHFSNCLPCLRDCVLTGRRLTDEELAGVLRYVTFSNAFDEYFDLQAFQPANTAQLKETETNAWNEFDILRLKVAARLYELETGKKVTATTDLVPSYFHEEIKERGTGASYRWTSNGELMGL